MRSIPVTITRRITATDDGGLLFSYAAFTKQVTPLPFFWSAHPLFRAESGSAITLPGGRESTLLQEYPEQRIAPWPKNGAMNSLPAGTAIKAFSQQPHAHSSAALTHPDGSQLTISWDSEALPYLGLFWDNSHFSPSPVIAIEPTTAQGDTPLLAESRNPIQEISADTPLVWWLAVHIDA